MCFKAAFKCFRFFPLYLQIRRQIIRYDFGFIQAGKIFNAVFQLPDIAVPFLIEQYPLRFVCERKIGMETFFKIIDQFQNIRSPLAQRRQFQTQYVQPVIQIFSESSEPYRFAEIFIRCGNNAHIDVDNAVAADPQHFFFLDNAQKLQLQRFAHAFDLIEKKRTAVCEFEKSHFAAFFRTRKSAFFIAKQFAFHKAVGNGSTVDRDERISVPFGCCMNCMCEKLFAGTAFSG